MIFKGEEEATAEGISGRPPPTQKMPKYQGGSKRRVKGQQVWSLTQFYSVSFFQSWIIKSALTQTHNPFFVLLSERMRNEPCCDFP